MEDIVPVAPVVVAIPAGAYHVPASMRNRAIWIILGAALLPRIWLLAAGWNHPGRFLTPDSHGYDSLARALLERGQFSRSPERGPEIFRTPGYPAFLAAVYGLTGGSVHAAVAVQVAADVVLCLLVYLLGRRLCSRGVGLLAAAIQAASPAAVAASVRLLSESLFALLLTAAVLLLIHFFRTSRWWAVLAAGGLTGLACLVRPIAGPFALVVAGLLLAARWKRPQWAGLFLLAAAACAAPWIARNYAVTRPRYAGLSSVGDINLLLYNALELAESDPAIELTPAQRALKSEWEASGQGLAKCLLKNSSDYALRCRREGWALIRRHPGRYAALHLRTTMNCFLPAATDVLEVAGITAGNRGTLAVLRREGIIAAVRHYFGGRLWPLWLCAPMVLITLGKHVGAMLGAARHVRMRMGPAGWLILLTILYFVLVPGPVAHARFRVPVEPLLSLAAAAGLAYLGEFLRAAARRRHRPSAPGA